MLCAPAQFDISDDRSAVAPERPPRGTKPSKTSGWNFDTEVAYNDENLSPEPAPASVSPMPTITPLSGPKARHKSVVIFFACMGLVYSSTAGRPCTLSVFFFAIACVPEPAVPRGREDGGRSPPGLERGGHGGCIRRHPRGRHQQAPQCACHRPPDFSTDYGSVTPGWAPTSSDPLFPGEMPKFLFAGCCL